MIQQKEEHQSYIQPGQPGQSMILSTKPTNCCGEAYRCLTALFYKSIKLQLKNYCSNILQIATPILAILFTLVVNTLTDEVANSQINFVNSPQFFQSKSIDSLFNNNLTCYQYYLYQMENTTNKDVVIEILGNIQRKYCDLVQNFNPQFIETPDVNNKIIQTLNIADLEPFQRGQDLKTHLPDGLMKFYNVSKNTLNMSIAINDFRLPEYHTNNGVTKVRMMNQDGSYSQITVYLKVTEGAMSLTQKITRSFLNLNFPKQIILGSYIYMPFSGKDAAFMNSITNVIGSVLYPLSLSLLLPLFLYSIVSQKQQKLLQIMKMNGLNIKYYWINLFVFNFILCILTFIIFYCFGRYAMEIQIFTHTSFTLFWVTFVGWAISMIGMVTFTQIFINNSKIATVVGYGLSVFSTLLGQPIVTFIFPDPKPLPNLLMAYPPFALCRAISEIAQACSNDTCMSSFQQANSEIMRCIYYLYGWIIIFFISIWLNDIVQQDYGVAHKPAVFKWIHRQFLKCKPRKNQEKMLDNDSQGEIEMTNTENMSQQIHVQQNDKIQSDYTVQNEFDSVSRMPINQLPLIVKQLSKKYQLFSGDKDYVALKPISIGLRGKQILGLLGPNGAGKTTFISVLTGMYPQTSGNAWINGQQVGYASTNRLIGVCPQFDLLWPQMTVYEHLKFYALLKGVQSSQIDECITTYINDFDLTEWRDTASKFLSGGMKRRLSIANGLVGNPSVVFLDEPSSGLDPGHRRQLWDILLKCKRKTSILLTTHLMEEAEVLCDRVGIIDRGTLKCIGDLHDLKERFGQGYRLTLNFTIPNESHEEVKKRIKEQFGGVVMNELTSRIIFKIQKSNVIKSIVYLKHIIKQQNLGINWLVNQPTLYDVFVSIVK